MMPVHELARLCVQESPPKSATRAAARGAFASTRTPPERAACVLLDPGAVCGGLVGGNRRSLMTASDESRHLTDRHTGAMRDGWDKDRQGFTVVVGTTHLGLGPASKHEKIHRRSKPAVPAVSTGQQADGMYEVANVRTRRARRFNVSELSQRIMCNSLTTTLTKPGRI